MDNDSKNNKSFSIIGLFTGTILWFIMCTLKPVLLVIRKLARLKKLRSFQINIWCSGKSLEVLINNCYFAFRKMRLMAPSSCTLQKLYHFTVYIAFSHLIISMSLLSHNFESSIVYFLDCWLQHNNKVKLL